MPQGSLRVSKPLTNLSVQYMNDEYISSKLAPNLAVKAESDLYWIYNNDFRIEHTNRANGAPAAEATYDMSTSSYTLAEYALKDKITMRDRNNVDSPLQLDRDVTEYLTDKIMLDAEKRLHDLLFTTTSFGNNTTLNTAASWLATTTATPVQDVLSATSFILGQGGGRANIAATNRAVMDALKEATDITERVKYSERAFITEDIVAAAMDLDEICVGTAVRNQAKEGLGISLTAIWGSDFLVARIEKSPRLKTRTAVVTLRGMQYGNPMRVRKYRDETIEADIIEVQTLYQHKLIATSSGYLIKTPALPMA